MKIQNFRKLTRNDFPQMDERFLLALNEQFENITTAIQGNLSFVDNINAELRDFVVKSNLEFTMTLQTLRGRPRTLFWSFRSSSLQNADLAWDIVNEKQIRIRVTLRPIPEIPETMTVLVLGS